MNVFLTSAVVAIVVGVVAVYALNTVQKPVETAFQAPASVRL